MNTRDLEAAIGRLAPRTRPLNDRPARAAGEFVLYWCTTALRASENPAFERAVAASHQLDRPLLVYRGLSARYGHANARIHRFILEGQEELRAAFEARGASVVFYLQQSLDDRERWVDRLAARAALVVVDDFPTSDVRAWAEGAARRAPCAVLAVDAACVVPMAAVGRTFDRAFAFRQAVERLWPRHLDPIAELPGPPVALGSDPGVPDTRVTAASLTDLLVRCPIDLTVPPAPDRRGGEGAAEARWERFRQQGLGRYAEVRNDALDDEGVSGMSPYLHFGMIWAGRLARDARARGDKGADKFLDELLVWRELSWGFCFHRRDHASLSAVPEWARQELGRRAPVIGAPGPVELDRGETGDTLWDAAQRRLRRDGWLHNNVRMTWGKQIVAWEPDPARALATLIELNHRYALDGRDPSSYGGLLWCLGLFDRPHAPLPGTGQVRARLTEVHARRLPPAVYGRSARARAWPGRRVVVVGAGLAGVACARTLADAGVDVTLLDQAPVVGGRLASRTIGGVRVDHGAPYLAPRGAGLRRWLEQLADERTVRRDGSSGPSRYGASGGMHEVVERLAAGLSPRTGRRAVALGREGGEAWVRCEGGEEVRGTTLVVALPAPQAVELLGHPATPAAWSELGRPLAGVTYERALVGVFRYDAAPDEAMLWRDQAVDDPLLEAIGVEHWKDRPRPLGVVARARAAPSEARYGDDAEAVLDDLAAAVARLVPGLLAPSARGLERWRYARPCHPLPGAFIASDDGSLVVAGDAFLSGDAEGAFQSGGAAATWLLGRWLEGAARPGS